MQTLPPQRLGQDYNAEQALDVWAQVQRVQAGDTEAYGPIYSRYADTVFRFVYFRVGNRQLAEDLTSEAFTRALKSIDSFHWEGRDFGAFLTTIARNIVADHFKSRRYKSEVLIEGPSVLRDFGVAEPAAAHGAGPEEATAAYLTTRMLMTAVKALGDDQRECIVLRFLRGMSLRETARLMGKQEAAVKALQFRAVASLRRMFPHVEDFGLPEPVTAEQVRHAEEPERTEAALARVWAADRGMVVSRTGRLPLRVLEMFRDEQVAS